MNLMQSLLRPMNTLICGYAVLRKSQQDNYKMPKNNPKPHIPRTPLPPEGPGGGEDGPPDNPERLLISLINLNIEALPGLQPGNPVTVRIDGLSLSAFTPMGTFLGEVGTDDLQQFIGKRIRRASVFFVSLSPAQCVIEVTT